MVQNPPENTPRITPYLYYENVAGAIEWLSRAFGLRERFRLAEPDGTVSHAELELEDGVVMVGSPGRDFQNPNRLGHATQSLYIYVDDVDAHYERAKAAGATILARPEEQFYGDRRYGAADPEGHHWFFAERVRDVSPEELQRRMGG
jgi:PhnB protein